MATPATQTVTNVPWTGLQPAIKTGLNYYSALMNNDTGYKAPTFQTYTPMSGQTQAGLDSMWGLANGGNPLAAESQGAVSGAAWLASQ